MRRTAKPSVDAGGRIVDSTLAVGETNLLPFEACEGNHRCTDMFAAAVAMAINHGYRRTFGFISHVPHEQPPVSTLIGIPGLGYCFFSTSKVIFISLMALTK